MDFVDESKKKEKPFLMKKIRIITDSTADLPERFQSQVRVVPLTVRFGEKEYTDGMDIDKQTFYRMLAESEALPTTSQATPAQFEAVFDETEAAGEAALVITLSSKLSGTYQSACIAAEGRSDIRVVDSLSVATGSGILAEYALRLAERGMDLDALAAEVTKRRADIRLVAMLDTLEYLKKGGRIPSAVALAGGILRVKPAITIRDGEVALLGAARGSKKANNFLNEKVRETGVDWSMPILLGYSGLSDELLTQYVRDSRLLWEGNAETLDRVQVCSVIGTHVGPGAIVVSYFCRG